jgi:hypothetical protein
MQSLPPGSGPVDVIDGGGGPGRLIRRGVLALVLVGLLIAGYAWAHRSAAAKPPRQAIGLVTPTPSRHIMGPVPADLLAVAQQAAARARASASPEADLVGGGAIDVTSDDPTGGATVEGVTTGTYVVTLVCAGQGSVLARLSDEPPDATVAPVRVFCFALGGPPVTVLVALRRPTLVLTADAGPDTLAGLGWSASPGGASSVPS